MVETVEPGFVSRRKDPAITANLLDQLLAGTDAAAALDQGGLLDSLKKAPGWLRPERSFQSYRQTSALHRLSRESVMGMHAGGDLDNQPPIFNKHIAYQNNLDTAKGAWFQLTHLADQSAGGLWGNRYGKKSSDAYSRSFLSLRSKLGSSPRLPFEAETGLVVVFSTWRIRRDAPQIL